MQKLKRFALFWREVFAEWSEDQASRFAAALALYTILSLGPLILLIVSVVGLVIGEDAAKNQIIENTQGIVGGQGAEVIQNVLENARRPGNGVTGAIIGFVFLILGLTGLVGQMQTALNTMWEIRPKPKQGIMGLLRRRLASLGTLAGLLFLFLVALVGSSAISALTGTFVGGAAEVGVQALNVVVSFVIFTLVFAFIYKVVPEADVRWRDVWVGAAVTSVLFNIGRGGIAVYLAYSKTASYFGAAGSLIVLIIFIYYSAQIFFVGAEFTQVFANRYGGRVKPEEHAEAIPEEPEESRGGAGAQAQKPSEETERRPSAQ
jgi:membrane protein